MKNDLTQKNMAMAKITGLTFLDSKGFNHEMASYSVTQASKV